MHLDSKHTGRKNIFDDFLKESVLEIGEIHYKTFSAVVNKKQYSRVASLVIMVGLCRVLMRLGKSAAFPGHPSVGAS